jgi:hypothetical protein
VWLEKQRRLLLLISTNFLRSFYKQAGHFHKGLCNLGLRPHPEWIPWLLVKEDFSLVTDMSANEVTKNPSSGSAKIPIDALMPNPKVCL